MRFPVGKRGNNLKIMQNLIIATARGYLGTRFHHQGRIGKTGSKGGGIDCLGLLVCVARDLDLHGKNGERLADFDARDYPHQPDTVALRQKLESLLYPIHTTGIAPGDIALFNVEGSPQHMGIITLLENRDEAQKFARPPAKTALSRTARDCTNDAHERAVAQKALFAARPGRIYGLIHAYAPARAVVEHPLDDYWRQKLVAAFRLPASTDYQE